ncbi:MAG: iron complex outermembrane receptor protein [Rickettsiales bacterium]|jgi:iron complex outermembrane receptor protein
MCKESTFAATTVSKTAKDSFKSAAAIYVVDRDDIKRSGATTIPEVLRMVPGLQVAQGEAGQWMVTSRGFANGFANKLLVMVDGRTIYTSLFSGVHWGAQDIMLENIKQIEVVRGPGATQWGANAVNGVINIITEPASNTQKGLATASYGNNHDSLSARYGGKIKNNSYYRISASNYNERSNESSNSESDHHNYYINRGGFRIDYDEFEKDLITLQSDFYKGSNQLDLLLPDTASSQNILKDNLDIYGGHITTKWEHQINNESATQLQFYYDKFVRDYSLLSRKSETFDIDFQYSSSLQESHKITFGLGYRGINSDLSGDSFRINFDPIKRNTNLYNTFIQDEITLLPEKVFLTIGSKLEHNSFTGYEAQPSVKTSWLVTENQTLWASIARATRTPNISENDIKMVVGTFGPYYTRQQGDTGFDSEKLIAYELGYRIRPSNDSIINLALFYNDYDDLRSGEFVNGGKPVKEGSNSFISIFPQNNGEGKAVGLELDGSIKINKKWELKSAYSYLKLDLDTKAGSTDSELEKEQRRSPKHQFNIQSRFDISDKITFDNILYYVDGITVTDNSSNYLKIPSYWRFDTHIGWQYSNNISFDFVGQNLLDDSHQEFSGALWSEPFKIGRSFYGKITLKF